MDDYIDAVRTGRNIKKYIKQSGYTVKEIQIFLGFKCPQSIYRWLDGSSLPTIAHLYMLSLLFDVYIEDMLVLNEMVVSKQLISFARYISEE